MHQNQSKRKKVQRHHKQNRQTDEHQGYQNAPATSVDNILNLQRVLGNQAVMRMMDGNEANKKPAKSIDTSAFGNTSKLAQLKADQSKKTSPQPIQHQQDKNTLQRWDIDGGDINLNDATEIGVVKTGQGVYFMKDATDDTIVVKAEDVEIGKTQLAGMLYEELTNSTSVRTQDVTDQKDTLINLFDDPNKLTSGWVDLRESAHFSSKSAMKRIEKEHPDWDTKQVTAEFHKGMLGFFPFLQAMDVADGKTAGDTMEDGVNVNERSFRSFLRSNSYMKELGRITAVDLFLENGDRAYAGNVGNWFNRLDTGAITLIDNLDAHASDMWSDDNDLVGQKDNLDRLAPSVLNTTATSIIDTLLDSMKNAGDDSVDTWAQEESPSNPGNTRYEMMVSTFEQGLIEGRATLIRILLKKKMKGTGRAIKAAAQAASQTDGKTGIDYWSRLKARVRYLKKQK